MLCPTCGNDIAQDARFCPRCGAPTGSPSQPGLPTQPAPIYGVPLIDASTRVSRHIQTLGMLWLIYAGWRFMIKLAGLFFLHGFLGHHEMNHWIFSSSPFTNDWMAALFPVALTSLIVSVALCVLTGYALLTRQPWGRVFGIIFGILALFHPFLGTILGIYTLWVLAPAASGVEYAAISQSAART
jgi:ABC-type glycerol-3-phosphate transport system permease component